ncbi:hypothetical protein [Aestuariivita sp.]|jgi:hypothetical protein|uniref:hypothetical protein n=1 Tax=Aestuariivita sp. TaxID=1872407 RepID=UPI00216EA9FD|nr:hypothetical protein [Aestuariivita sp.]MCE8005411.1 hypothetical protein [Aestuariivita sp.]
MIFVLVGFEASLHQSLIRRLRRAKPNLVFDGIGSRLNENGGASLSEFDDWLHKYLAGSASRKAMPVCFILESSSGFCKEVKANYTLAFQVCCVDVGVSISNPNAREKAVFQVVLNDVEEAYRIQKKVLSPELHQANNTPAPLPFQNFSCKKTNRQVNVVKEAVWRNDQGEISRAIKGLRRVCPKNVESGGAFFRSGKGLRFKTPGKYEHGERRPEFGPDLGHSATCWFRAHYRFGAKIRSAFHYDCEPEKVTGRGNMKSLSFVGCHEQEMTCSKPTHANIYPNEFVR